MKKPISVLATFALTSTSATGLVGCGQDNTFKIAFVPSKNNTDVTNQVRPLEQLLGPTIKKYYKSFNKTIKVDVTTDYNVAGQAVKDGKDALGFLPVGTYTKYWGKATTAGTHQDISPLVVAQRQAMLPDMDTNNDKKMNIDTNFNAQKDIVSDYTKLSKGISSHEDAYKALYSTTDQVSYYRSEVLVNNTFLKTVLGTTDVNSLFSKDETEYKTNINTLITAAYNEGKINLLTKDLTSSAGVVYPVAWMLNNLTGTQSEKETLISKILKLNNNVATYSDAAEKVSSGEVDMTFGYTDIRADNTNNVKSDYENSSMVGITSGINNDGIDYSKKAVQDPLLVDALRKAFAELIKTHPEIFAVYSHSAYEIPADGEDSTTWEAKYDRKYADANNDPTIAEALKIVNAINA